VECGLRLERMPAQDMLDVLHYLFESDAISTEEEQDAKHRMRTALYSQLYEREYTWGGGSRSSSRDASGHEFGTQEVGGGGTQEFTHKPYVPPTPVNADAALPYGNVLDAPLG
jgi:hypothetical protein